LAGRFGENIRFSGASRAERLRAHHGITYQHFTLLKQLPAAGFFCNGAAEAGLNCFRSIATFFRTRRPEFA
jgi:hypothetical protein